jgi:hypothetical protein
VNSETAFGIGLCGRTLFLARVLESIIEENAQFVSVDSEPAGVYKQNRTWFERPAQSAPSEKFLKA